MQIRASCGLSKLKEKHIPFTSSLQTIASLIIEALDETGLNLASLDRIGTMPVPGSFNFKKNGTTHQLLELMVNPAGLQNDFDQRKLPNYWDALQALLYPYKAAIFQQGLNWVYTDLTMTSGTAVDFNGFRTDLQKSGIKKISSAKIIHKLPDYPDEKTNPDPDFENWFQPDNQDDQAAARRLRDWNHLAPIPNSSPEDFFLFKKEHPDNFIFIQNVNKNGTYPSLDQSITTSFDKIKLQPDSRFQLRINNITKWEETDPNGNVTLKEEPYPFRYSVSTDNFAWSPLNGWSFPGTVVQQDDMTNIGDNTLTLDIPMPPENSPITLVVFGPEEIVPPQDLVIQGYSFDYKSLNISFAELKFMPGMETIPSIETNATKDIGFRPGQPINIEMPILQSENPSIPDAFKLHAPDGTPIIDDVWYGPNNPSGIAEVAEVIADQFIGIPTMKARATFNALISPGDRVKDRSEESYLGDIFFLSAPYELTINVSEAQTTGEWMLHIE